MNMKKCLVTILQITSKGVAFSLKIFGSRVFQSDTIYYSDFLRGGAVGMCTAFFCYSHGRSPPAPALYFAYTVFSQPFLKHGMSVCCTLVFRLRQFSVLEAESLRS